MPNISPIDVNFYPIAGDHSDNDGTAIDEFFEAQDPAPSLSSDSVLIADALPETTRMLVRTLPFSCRAAAPDNPSAGVMMFPADPYRKKLSIFWECTGNPTVARGLIVGSSASDMNIQQGVFNNVIPIPTQSVPSGGQQSVFELNLDGHTGPVWVRPAWTLPISADLDIRVTGVCVTK